ncbi:MAG: EH domain-containing protein 4, partial [Paramarteilia canceri]
AYFYLINAIRDKLSIWKSTETQKKKLLDEVEQLISTVANENNIHESEFPDTDSIKENIRRRPLSAFVTVKAKYFNEIKALEDNISAMIAKASIKTKDSGLNYQSKKDDNPFLNQEEEYSNIITPNLVERIKTEFLNISGAFDKDIKISEFTELMIKRAGVNREVLAKAWDIAFKEEKKVISFVDYGTMVFLVELVNNDINMPNTIPQSWKLILSS